MSNKVTAQELIYKQMVADVIELNDDILVFLNNKSCPDSAEDYYDLWDEMKGCFSECWDVEYEARYGDQEVSDLEPKTSSRHYEIEVRASEIDGVWVAWDFYYGGGKHGEPEAFDWISNARIVDCEERVVTKTEYVFKECT